MSTLFVSRSYRTDSLASICATSILAGKKWKHCERSKGLTGALVDANNNIDKLEISYVEKDRGITLENGDKIFIGSTLARDIFGSCPSVNLTSVDVGEIWVLLRLLSSGLLDGLEFYYCSPSNYMGAGVGRKSIRAPLSDGSGNWNSLPGLTTEWNNDDLPFKRFSILGFDVFRLGSLDSYEGFPDSQVETLILADPPTSPFWVERSLRENHQLIKRVMHQDSDVEPILRVSGICPSTVFSYFSHLYRATEERWCFLPLGPRIQTLGTLIFASNQLDKDTLLDREPRIGVLYDFPTPKPSSITMQSNDFSNVWQFKVERK